MLPPQLSHLPAPSTDAHELHTRHQATIGAAIAASGGWLSFARYMELALYAPGLGYYSAGSAKLGSAGDFVTAPEISVVAAQMPMPPPRRAAMAKPIKTCFLREV